MPTRGKASALRLEHVSIAMKEAILQQTVPSDPRVIVHLRVMERIPKRKRVTREVRIIPRVESQKANGPLNSLRISQSRKPEVSLGRNRTSKTAVDCRFASHLRFQRIHVCLVGLSSFARAPPSTIRIYGLLTQVPAVRSFRPKPSMHIEFSGRERCPPQSSFEQPQESKLVSPKSAC